MEHVEVFGLELQVFGEGEDQFVLVPRLIGQTQELAVKGNSELVPTWGPEQLRAAYQDLADRAVADRPSLIASANFSTGRRNAVPSWRQGRRVQCSGSAA
jgi:hypothetical protein